MPENKAKIKNQKVCQKVGTFEKSFSVNFDFKAIFRRFKLL